MRLDGTVLSKRIHLIDIFSNQQETRITWLMSLKHES